MSANIPEKKTANPGPLGLLGFGAATILSNLHNAGIIEEFSIVIAAMGLALGGAAQIIAGIWELRLGNTFGGTAFSAYGLFWWSLGIIWINPFKGPVAGPGETALGFYFLLWGVFTIGMVIGAFAHNIITRIIFLCPAILFCSLALGHFTQNRGAFVIAGYAGITGGLAALYAVFGQIVNGELKKRIIPL